MRYLTNDFKYMSVNPSTLSVIGDIVGIEGGGSIDFDTDADTIVSGSLPFTDTNWQQGTMIRIVLARDGNEYILGTFDGTAADATIKNGAYSGSIELHSRLDALTITPYQYTISAGTTAKEVISDAFNNSGVRFEWDASSDYRYTSVQNYDVGSEWLTIASDACNLASLRFSIDKTGLVRIIDDFDAFSLSPSVTFTSVPDYHGVRIVGDIKQQTKRMSMPNRIIAATSGDDAKTAYIDSSSGIYAAGRIIAKKIDAGDNDESAKSLSMLSISELKSSRTTSDVFSFEVKCSGDTFFENAAALVFYTCDGIKSTRGVVTSSSLKLDDSLSLSVSFTEEAKYEE